MNRTTEVKKAKEYFRECADMLEKKAHDYAQEDDCFSNFKKIAIMCDIPTAKVFLMFISVKIARLAELTVKGYSQTGESMQDSLKDMANYSVLMSLYLDEEAK